MSFGIQYSTLVIEDKKQITKQVIQRNKSRLRHGRFWHPKRLNEVGTLVQKKTNEDGMQNRR